MRTIWKFPLSPAAASINAPAGAKPLFVGLDPVGTPCLWMEVDDSQPRREFPCFIVATGQQLPEKAATYLGTFILQNHGLVFHVYTK